MSNVYSQSAGTFTTITFNDLVKSGSPKGIFGWGQNFDRTVDIRPNPHPDNGTMMINHHTGITFSAHSFYGGIRFYNQGYPNTFDASTGAKLVMSITEGNVGIGTATPTSKLDIAGGYINVNAGVLGTTAGSTLKRNSSFVNSGNANYLDVYDKRFANGADWYSTSTRIQRRIDVTDQAFISFGVEAGDGAGVGIGSGNTYALVANANGNVGIGTLAPTEKLSVKGKIRAQEIKVEMANWYDFVFDKDYNNASLPDVEKFIKENHHLPNIPSATEVEKDGINLGEMNAKLLQKIEELTLHLIEQNKTQMILVDKVDHLQAEIRSLKTNK
ncbi:MAG: hypothetical protein JWQ25_2581 [Daejeonella sp.]|nr:hypothetical protein [Daejeonella sp.]